MTDYKNRISLLKTATQLSRVLKECFTVAMNAADCAQKLHDKCKNCHMKIYYDASNEEDQPDVLRLEKEYEDSVMSLSSTVDEYMLRKGAE